MKQTDLFEFTHTWNAPQVLAAYEFCRQMCEALWEQHEDILHEHIRHDAQGCRCPPAEEDRNLQLPFNDDIPF